MVDSPSIRVVDWFNNPAVTHDVLIASLGFETRAIEVARALPRAKTRYAFGFEDRQALAYSSNCAFFTEQGFDIRPNLDDHAFKIAMRNAIGSRADTEGGVMKRVLIDISSMTRARLAVALVEALHAVGDGCEVDFVYAVAEFAAAPEPSDSILQFGPVIPEFAGWPRNPDSPMILVLGLGYEADRALGAAELLEPADAWAFQPGGIDRRYDDALAHANEGLSEILRGPDRLIPYSVVRPVETFHTLTALLDGITREDRSRAIILPFGPKIFALIAMLAQLRYSAVGVWRVSAGHLEPAIDRRATGMIVGVTVTQQS